MPDFKKGDKVLLTHIGTKNRSKPEWKHFKKDHPEYINATGIIKNIYETPTHTIYTINFITNKEVGLGGWYFQEDEIKHATPNRIEILNTKLGGN